MKCEPCALHAAGEAQHADRIEQIRAQRLLLAVLNGVDDVTELIAAELRTCQPCSGRLASIYLGLSIATVVHIHGSRDAAARAIEHTLAEDLDAHAHNVS